MADTLGIFSWRWDAAHGWRWIRERTVTAESAERWLTVFRLDERGIDFVVAAKKPKKSPPELESA